MPAIARQSDHVGEIEGWGVCSGFFEFCREIPRFSYVMYVTAGLIGVFLKILFLWMCVFGSGLKIASIIFMHRVGDY